MSLAGKKSTKKGIKKANSNGTASVFLWELCDFCL